MKMPTSSAYKIQENITSVESYYSEDSKKYGYHIKDSPEMYCFKIFSSEAVYSTKENALKEGKSLIKKIQNMSFAPQRKSISDSFLEI